MAEDASNPVYTGFDLQRALENANAPFNTLAQGRRIVAVDQLARSRQLQDIASERSYRTSEADREMQRRMKEKQETDRLAALEEAAKNGIALPSDSSFADIATATRQKAQDQARARLDILSAQKVDLQARQQRAQEDLLDAAKSTGDDVQKRRALQATLNDATVTHSIPKEKLDYLKSVLSDPTKDPTKAVQQVSDALKEDFGGINWLTLGLSARHPVMRGTAEGNAQNFFNSYQTNLAGIVDPTKQADLATKMAALRDINAQAESFQTKALDVVSQFSSVLPRGEINQWSTKTLNTAPPPPQDPNSVFSNGKLPPVKQGSGTTQQAPTPPPPPAPLPTTSGTSTAPPVPSTFSAPPSAPRYAMTPAGPMALPGSEQPREEIPGLNPADSLIAAMRGGPYEDPNASKPFSLSDALANRVRIDVQNNPNQTLLPASQSELAQAHQLNASLHGITPQQSQENISAAMADPAKKAVATASLNALVKVIRARNAGVPDASAGQMPTVPAVSTATDSDSQAGPYGPER